jgi:hypothetical protein
MRGSMHEAAWRNNGQLVFCAAASLGKLWRGGRSHTRARFRASRLLEPRHAGCPRYREAGAPAVTPGQRGRVPPARLPDLLAQ